jgi:hypothetical protein
MNDYLIDPVTSDLQIADGDFVIGDATLQNQKMLLFAAPGNYKQYPTVGVDIMDFLKDDNQADMLRTITQQFTMDGMNVQSLSYQNGMFYIIAPYNQ